MLNTMFPHHSVKPHTSATEILITKTHTIRGMCQLLINEDKFNKDDTFPKHM